MHNHQYVIDRDNNIWLVTRDGGMAARADYAGQHSAGIKWLEEYHGPLTFFDVSTLREALKDWEAKQPTPDQS